MSHFNLKQFVKIDSNLLLIFFEIFCKIIIQIQNEKNSIIYYNGIILAQCDSSHSATFD